MFYEKKNLHLKFTHWLLSEITANRKNKNGNINWVDTQSSYVLYIKAFNLYKVYLLYLVSINFL